MSSSGLEGWPDLQKESGGNRYSSRGPTRPWTPSEDLVLWPVLQSCGRHAFYREACYFLCLQLNRPPSFPPEVHPTYHVVLDAAVKLIDHRLVSDIMREHRSVYVEAVLEQARRQKPESGFCRTGRPLSWAEKQRILQPFWYNRNDQKRIALGELLALMDRGEPDAGLVTDYFETTLSGTHPGEVVEDITGERPYQPGDQGRLAELLHEYRRVDPVDTTKLREAWCTLVSGVLS